MRQNRSLIKDEYKKQAKDIFDNAFPKIITVARLDKRKSHQNILMTIKNLKSKFRSTSYEYVEKISKMIIKEKILIS